MHAGLKAGWKTGNGILSCVGNTPLVRLDRLAGDAHIEVFAKIEATNPGGSIKDRAALRIIQDAMSRGMIKPGGLVVESSSGNMAIALAQTCLYFGLNCICVVDSNASSQNLRIVQAYGAKVELVTDPDSATGEFLVARLRRVRELLVKFPAAFWPDQYSNQSNADAHYHTMAEIATSLGSRVNYLFCSTSTCGTLRGCSEYIRCKGLDTKLYAVDALGSAIFDDKRCRRIIPGHGAGIRPLLFQPSLADRALLVSDWECIVGCRRLLRTEAILAGGSSGAVVMAFERVKQELEAGSTCVLIFPDRGERYLDTIYSDEWVRRHAPAAAGNMIDDIDASQRDDSTAADVAIRQ